MNELNDFLKNRFNKAVELKEKFKVLEKKEWDAFAVLLELGVQIGHVYNVFNKDQQIIEENRPITNLGDELSDILLQLIYLVHIEDITIDNLSFYKDYSYTNLSSLSILYGQLSESFLEKKEYRFQKPRSCFYTIDDFIKDRIIKMLLIIFNYAKINHLNMIKEFDEMYEDATNFIKRKLSSDGNN